MFQKINATILILLFIALFSFESIEFFCGESFEHQETTSGILELEEENSESEESKEEEEELKFNDANVSYKISSVNYRLLLNKSIHPDHFFSSDYSQKVFSPPELV